MQHLLIFPSGALPIKEALFLFCPIYQRGHMMAEVIRKTTCVLGRRSASALHVIFFITLAVVACALKTECSAHGQNRNDAFPSKHWETAVTPEAYGWSGGKLAKARAYSKRIGSAAVMIVDDGVVVDAWGDIEKNFYCHSIRKSLLNALIGIHVEKGDFDLSKTMKELGIDDVEPSLSPMEKQATVLDLIKARSGIYHPALGEGYFMATMRPSRNSRAPGTFWYYNNWDFNALGTIFEKETGTQIFEEFDARIAKPLQMEDFNADHCAYKASEDYGSGLISMHRYYQFRMSTRDLARFGLLYLREGRWRGQEIVPAEWVRESTTAHSHIWPDGGYGYLWWTGIRKGFIANVEVQGHSFMASGAGVNKVFVLPYLKLVVVHRVDTFKGLPQQLPGQVGRLLWLILDAAGEKNIGADPSIEAARGVSLKSGQLEEILKKSVTWVGINTGPIPGGDRILFSFFEDGKLFYTVGENKGIEGKWRVNDDKLYVDLMGMKLFFFVLKDGGTYNFFDPTGTLFGEFKQLNN